MTIDHLRTSLILLLLLAACVPAALADAGAPRELLQNPGFSAGPAGTIAAWTGTVSRATVGVEDGVPILHLSNRDPATEVRLTQSIAVDPSWYWLRLTGRMRVTEITPGKLSWQNARVQMEWDDSAGKPISPWPSAVQFTEPTQGWVSFTETYQLPPNAVVLKIAPSILNAVGEADFAGLSLVMLGGKNDRVDAPYPVGWIPARGTEPVETLSATRGEILLNGLWQFQPAAAGEITAPAGGWGYIPVPGAWSVQKVSSLPGVAAMGIGINWAGLSGTNGSDSWNALEHAWYARTIKVPEDWRGRRILLNFLRVSTDAHVWIDGVDCGSVSWPGGWVDVTRAVTPGKVSDLRVRVDAPAVSGTQTVFMGTGAGQNETAAIVMNTRGIISDVSLESEPLGPRVSDVFVQPSTRKKLLTLSIELTGVTQPGPVMLVARCLNEHGAVEKTFQARIMAVAAGTQTVNVSWPWPHARLWDFAQPNLYTLELSAHGAGIADEYPQPFGFREFWIQGRDYYLNGIPIHFRPMVLGNEQDREYDSIEEIDGVIDGFMANGFNLQEFWPWDEMQRGAPRFLDLWFDRADRKGWPVIGALPSMSALAAHWNEPGVAGGWERDTLAEVKRLRNHPSVLMWVHSPNHFGNWQDQNPRYEGRLDKLTEASNPPNALDDAAWDATRAIKRWDPTRPVTTHEGIVGDIQTVNQYVDVMPMQEQEEWISDWVQHGTEPFFPVEFGPLISCDFRRGRNTGGWNGPPGAVNTENETTEFLAMFFGPAAYEQETDAQRRFNPENFLQDQAYRRNSTESKSPLAEEAVAEEVRAEYLGWRTLGTSSGMTWWDYGSWWQRDNTMVPMPPFVAGRRGVYHDAEPESKLHFLQPAGATILPPARMLVYASQPTLAWIVGPAVPGDVAAFTDKAHSFTAGEVIHKQIALLNDTRVTLAYRCAWSATIGGRSAGSGEHSGTIAPTERVFLPIAFTASAPAGSDKADGKIRMTAVIGEVKHDDAFSFRVFAPPAATGQTVDAADPDGLTAKLLLRLGYRVVTWTGQATRDLVVIGRDALSEGKVTLASLEPVVRAGGRVVVMAQDPEWIRATLQMRVGHQLDRRVFRIDPNHPVVAGLDDVDLSDWAGSSTLVAPYPVVTVADKSSWGYPTYGWHWGNRAAVTSAPIEKPHRTSWRPILDCDFDCAFTPLMEMDYGQGRITFCTLDLEDHASLDAAAARLARNVFEYARTAPLTPKAATVVYAGGDAWASKLTALGVVFTRSATVPASADLLIVDPDAGLDKAAVEGIAQGGGSVLVLPSESGHSVFGATYVQTEGAHGSTHVPAWPECRGLSESDLRVRAPHTDWLLAGGAEIGADGLLARRAVGRGVMIFTQTDPDRFDADRLTYFRFTRWRQTRALSQVLANLGASFAADSRFFTGALPAGSTDAGLYYPDYRTDFALGDDPHRYYRW